MEDGQFLLWAVLWGGLGFSLGVAVGKERGISKAHRRAAERGDIMMLKPPSPKITKADLDAWK